MPMRTCLAIAAAVAAVAAACGESDAPEGAGEPPSVGGGLVLQVSTPGGFLPGRNLLPPVPALTLYGDGLLLEPAPETQQYPGPLLTPLQEARVRRSAVEQIIGEAAERGLLDESVDYGRDIGVADASTTRVWVSDGDRTVVHEAYGLEPGLEGDRLSEKQREARRNLLAFLDAAREALSERQDGRAHQAPAFALRSQPATEGGDGPGSARDAEPWPLARTVPLASARNCILVEGDAAGELRSSLASADELTVFRDDGAQWRVAVRPVLPEIPGCG